jgi:hypothetical protein
MLGRCTASQIAGVVAVVLAALAIRRYEPRRHDPDRVAELLEAPRPFVRSRAGFQPNHACGPLRNRLHQPVAAHGLAHHHRTRLVDAVHAEHVLRQVDTHRSNLAHDFPS